LHRPVDDLTIRAARPSEAPDLADLALRSKAYWGYRSDELDLWRDELAVTAELMRTMRIECAVVAERLVGFFVLASRGGTAELEHLWVEPVWIGRAIGRALFERAVVVAREEDARELRVVADPHAAGFYLRMGAVQVGEQPSKIAGRCLPVLTFDLGGSA
jgi:GNAT superfamily N-acetyltransferase